jgi:hypothetical protein
LGVDHAIPLSDHADYDELFEAVERVNPRIVYCTHGPASFVDCLRAAGHNAHPLDGPRVDEPVLAPVQKDLFYATRGEYFPELEPDGGASRSKT